MTDHEYLRIQATMIELGKEIIQLDFKGFIAKSNNSDILGPILDPVLHEKAKDNLTAIRELAKAYDLVKTRHTVLELVARKTRMREMT